MEWRPTRSALRFGNKQSATAKVYVADPEVECLSKPQPRAVENENEGAVERAAESRPIQSPDQAEQQTDVRRGQDVGYEARFPGQVWPTRFAGETLWTTPMQIFPELTNDAEVHRYADGLSVRSTCEPGQHSVAHARNAVLANGATEKTIEAPKHEFGALVAIAPASLECQES